MMNSPKNFHEQLSLIEEILTLKTPVKQRDRVLNEFNTGRYRFVIPGKGYKRNSFTSKLTAAEKQAADDFAKTLPIQTSAQILEAMEKGFDLASAPQSSRQTYGARMRSSLALIEAEPWYPGNGAFNRRSPDECRPKTRYGRGDWKSLSLMEGKGKQIRYRLRESDISPILNQQMGDFHSFMADVDYFDRHSEALECSTASGYDGGMFLWLGHEAYYYNPSIDPQELTLETLIPKVTRDSLDGMTSKEQKALWTTIQRRLEARINNYFEFLRTQQKATSPRTRLLKLATLLILAKFLYASEVEDEDGYKNIPIIHFILKRIEKEQAAVEQWEKDRRYVADQSRKWPVAPSGQTTLEYVQEALIDPLRLECRPRQSTGDFCKGHIIAKSKQVFLLFANVGLLPPGRQQELRTYRIALSCPLIRPETVPSDGVYWPLPPDWARERRQRDDSVADNYLHKTYYHDGQFYEQGIWIREQCQYKTYRHHGKRMSVIHNLIFDDGHCLYDYIEQYLCGQWYVGNFHQGHRYDWWDPSLRGSYGKWLSLGRAELCSDNTPVFTSQGKTEVCVSSYLFLNPTNGKPFTDIQMSDLFSRNSYRILGKRITPHTFRYMWATWAGQMELSDAEFESLAHAMGSTAKTLRDMYERCSPAEKNRPINRAMGKLFLWRIQQGPKPIPTNPPRDIKEYIAQLTPDEMEELQKLLGIDPAA